MRGKTIQMKPSPKSIFHWSEMKIFVFLLRTAVKFFSVSRFKAGAYAKEFSFKSLTSLVV